MSVYYSRRPTENRFNHRGLVLGGKGNYTQGMNTNGSVKTALIIIVVAVVGCVGGLKIIGLGVKYFMNGQILTGPGNDPVK